MNRINYHTTTNVFLSLEHYSNAGLSQAQMMKEIHVNTENQFTGEDHTDVHEISIYFDDELITSDKIY